MEEFLNFGSEYFENGLAVFAVRSVLLYFFGLFVTRMIRKSIQKEALVRGDHARTPIQFIGNVVVALIWAVVLFLILNDVRFLAGIGRAILGATSLIAVIVTFAAQEAFSNLIAGFFLALYQPFRLGDLIKLSEKDINGTVMEITLRHTIIRTYDGTQVIIPNSIMNSQIVENKRTENNLFSRQIVLSVAYDTDIDKAKEVLTKAVTETEGFVDPRSEEEKKAGEPPVSIVVSDFLDSGIELRFRVYTRTSAEHYALNGKVRENVLRAFRENNIEIPYPTRVVELRK